MARPPLYRDTQLIDTAHLISLILEQCDKVGMSPFAHKQMARRQHPQQLNMAAVNERSRAKNVDVTFGWTAVMWIKVFGWSFIVHLEGREYSITCTDDFRNVIVDYLNRHDMPIHHLEKFLLKNSGGPSISRLYYQTLKHIQLNTSIRAIEGMGGHIALRRPKKR